jgi:hypothetical protein
MHLKHSSVLGAVAFAALAVGSGTARAKYPVSAQICSLGSAAVGNQGTLICKDVLTGATTQSIALGPTVAEAGGIGGASAATATASSSRTKWAARCSFE